jgi:hypothetical protein
MEIDPGISNQPNIGQGIRHGTDGDTRADIVGHAERVGVPGCAIEASAVSSPAGGKEVVVR